MIVTLFFRSEGINTNNDINIGMANHRASEPRTYIRVPKSWAERITKEAKENEVSVPEYLKDKRVICYEG